jgi:hypothetical protein
MNKSANFEEKKCVINVTCIVFFVGFGLELLFIKLLAVIIDLPF